MMACAEPGTCAPVQVALLAYQGTVDSESLFADSGVPLTSEIGAEWTLLAVCVLAAVGFVLTMGLLMLRNFWLQFRTKCWKRPLPPVKGVEVTDPLFRLYSNVKACLCCLSATPLSMPSDAEIERVFMEYDRDGSGSIDVSELHLALSALGLCSERTQASIHAMQETLQSINRGMLSVTASTKEVKAAIGQRVSTMVSGTAPALACAAESTTDRPDNSGVRGQAAAHAGDSPSKSSDAALVLHERRQRARFMKSTTHTLGLLHSYDISGNGTLSKAGFALMIRDLVRQSMAARPVSRSRGKWAKPAGEAKEPARTERLLASPFVFRRSYAADCQDSMSLNLFGKTSGSRWAARMHHSSTLVHVATGRSIVLHTLTPLSLLACA